MKRSTVFAFVGVFIVGLFIVGLRGLSKPRPRNLILISLDALRADRLGAYGYSRPTSPALDAWAGQHAVTFDRAISVSSWTLPTHMTMMTGLYPSRHGVHTPGRKLPRTIPVLAELLRAQGYRTFGYTGGSYVGARYGFRRGFEEYEENEVLPEKNLHGFAASLDRAKAQIQSLSSSEPYYLFLHTFDIHCPYNPSEPYASMFQSPGAHPVDPSQCVEIDSQAGPRAEQALFLSDHYDGEIRRVDDLLGGFLQFLADRGELERTVVVITADHGEEFFEHGRVGHQQSLYRELLEVPLFMAIPGVTARRISQAVSQVDLLPTMLELVGLPAPEGIDGRSLVPMLSGAPLERAFQFSELHHQVGLRSRFDTEHHLIESSGGKETKLFSVPLDRQEVTNLIERESVIAAQKGEELRDFIANVKANNGTATAAKAAP